MAEITIVYGLPRSNERRSIYEADLETARLNNQFFVSGTDPSFPQEFPNSKNIIAFLEFVQASTAFTLEDCNGTVFSGLLTSPFGDAHAPLRIDGGFKLNGTIIGAKGFYIIK